MQPRYEAWSLMVRAGVDGEAANDALQELIRHVRETDAACLRLAHPSLGDPAELENVAQFLENPQVRREYLPAPAKGCGCFPHGPDEPCTCTGCTSCVGHELNCSCDIDFDCAHKEG